MNSIEEFMKYQYYMEMNRTLDNDGNVLSICFVDKNLRDFVPACIIYPQTMEFEFRAMVNPGAIHIHTGKMSPLSVEHFTNMKEYILKVLITLKDAGFRL